MVWRDCAHLALVDSQVDAGAAGATQTLALNHRGH